jgi:hypothetical protein
MEVAITGGVVMGLLTGLVGYVWHDMQKRIDLTMPRELCAERHLALEKKLDSISDDLKWVMRALRRMNGEADE